MSSTKNIENYLHLYIGCQVFWQTEYLLTASLLSFFIGMGRQNELKPVLRKLEDITEEEANERAWGGKKGFERFQQNRGGAHYPDDFIWLLSKGFDLFGLIEAGLAIDKTTLK